MTTCPKCGMKTLCVGHGSQSYGEECTNCDYKLIVDKTTLPDSYNCSNCGSANGKICRREGKLVIKCLDCLTEDFLVYTRENSSQSLGPRPLRSKPVCTGPVSCPECGSTQISTGARGYSWFWGFIGSGDTVNRCANCGHKWRPKG